MESDTRLINVLVLHLKAFGVVRRSDFRKYTGTPLPGIEALLDRISRQFEKETALKSDINAESILVQALLSAHSDQTLNCFSSKKKKVHLNILRIFRKWRQFLGWRAAIYREYDSLMNRSTLSYMKQSPSMKTVPSSCIFLMNPPNTDENKFIGKARCCLRGDRQLAYTDFDTTNV